MNLRSLAFLGLSLVSTVCAGVAQAANPLGFAYSETTNVSLYGKPTGVVVTGRCNRYSSVFQTVRTKLDTTKRTVTERIPDKQLFVPFAIIAALLVGLELLLSHTRLRRLP